MTAPSTRIPAKLAYNVKEAAEQLSLHSKSVLCLIHAGKLAW